MLVLCGHPEQNHGGRSAPLPPSSRTCIALSLACRIAKCASMRALVSASSPIFCKRRAIARAISAGDRSALERSKVLAVGLGIDHSPPEKSPSTSLNLP